MKIRQAIYRLYFARSGVMTVFANDNTPGEGNSARVSAPRRSGGGPQGGWPSPSDRAGAFAVSVRLFRLREFGRRKLYLLYQSGLLILSENEENMTLKLILILGLPLLLGSTECGNQEGNTRRSPFFTLTTT